MKNMLGEEMSRGDIAKAVLLVTGVMVMIPVAAALGNGVQAIPGIIKFFKKKPTKRQEYYVSETITRLQRQGYLERKGEYLKLTEKGHSRLADLEIAEHAIHVPKKWDGKFRVIIFDIPIGKNRLRIAIRRQLAEWGFRKLQHSVWVHAYECREAVSLLKTRFGLNNDVLYMVVDEIENDYWLRQEFGLPVSA